MCGITAVSRADRSSIPNINLFMRQASYAIEKRGPHATGFGWVDGKGKTWYWRSPGKATQVAHKVDMSGARIAIGHTRFATQGKPEKNENNHPIIEEGITLVHNGIVDNDWWIFKHLSDVVRTNEVDSQAIACLLAYPQEFRWETTADLFENEFEGDAAIAWLDRDIPDTLNLSRIVGRPMHIGRTKKGDLVMASEDENLEMLSRMSGVTITDIEEVPEGTILQVVKGEIVDAQSFKPYESTKTWGGTSVGSKPKTATTTTVTSITKKEDEKKEALDLPRGDDDWEDLYHNWDDLRADPWCFEDWSDERLAFEMWIDWKIDKDNFDDPRHFDKTLAAFKEELVRRAELADMLEERILELGPVPIDEGADV